MDRNHLFASSGVDFAVALRKESVDRNLFRLPKKYRPSAVALRKESVDRNKTLIILIKKFDSRSPQGERG